MGKGSVVQRKRASVTETIGNIGERFQAPQLRPHAVRNFSTEQGEVTHGHPTQPTERVTETAPTADQMRARRRLTELLQKKDLVEQGEVGVTWSREDEVEFQELYQQVYPEG